jgi:hypothetical protein
VGRGACRSAQQTERENVFFHGSLA